MLSKEEADKLMKIKGNAKGAIFQAHAAYIRAEKGEAGIKKVEDGLENLGYPLRFEEIKPMEWYPEAHSVLTILVAKDAFNWNDNDISDMGNSAPKYSTIVKLLMRYFLSLERTFKESPKYWRKHFDFGKVETVKFSEKEKYLIVRVKDYAVHPIVCLFHAGFFKGLAHFVLKSEKINVEETKCIHRGDPYHEYVIRW